MASYSGTYSNSNGRDPNCGPDSVGHGIPVVDPLIGRYTIPRLRREFNNYKQTGGALVLTPGVYCGGIDIGGSVTTATFSPGTYVLVGGGMKIGSSANATGAGVTFFNTYPGTQTNKYDGIRISTSGSVSFTAPTTGSNKALLFYQDPTVPWSSSNGSQITAVVRLRSMGSFTSPQLIWITQVTVPRAATRCWSAITSRSPATPRSAPTTAVLAAPVPCRRPRLRNKS